MDVREIAGGLWRWTGWHAEWREDVGSVYCETPDAVCLIDPIVPPEDAVRFLEALDRDVERTEAPVHVLLTVFYHARDARALVERYGAGLWAPSRARAAVERRAGPVSHAFRPGERLPAGIEAFPSGRSAEVLYWLPARRALVAGDVLLGGEGGGIRLCPESWLPRGVGHRELRRAMRPLLGLGVERVLVSHGEPIAEGGSAALAGALGS